MFLVGCGKSIAAYVLALYAEIDLTRNRGAVIDHLDSDQSEQRPPVLSYFVDTARNQHVTVAEILRALVKQLLLLHQALHGEISRAVDQSIRACLSGNEDVLTLKALTHILISLIQEVGACDFVVDGIDVMGETDIIAFIELLSNIFDGSASLKRNCRLILFCRETLGRGIRLESIPQSCTFNTTSIHVRRDIHSYVDHEIKLKQATRPISDNQALIDRVATVLKMNSEKM